VATQFLKKPEVSVFFKPVKAYMVSHSIDGGEPKEVGLFTEKEKWRGFVELESVKKAGDVLIVSSVEDSPFENLFRRDEPREVTVLKCSPDVWDALKGDAP
jgi:hypothetical protein